MGRRADIERVLEARALEAVEALLDHPVTPESAHTGLGHLCHLCADLVEADAAGHVRYDRPGAASRLCLWSRSTAMEPIVAVEDEPSGGGATPPRDWWTTSRARLRVYAALDSRHLAELPLRLDPDSPSVVVVSRTRPFHEGEADELTWSRPVLLLVERLVYRLLDAPTQTGGSRRVLGGVSRENSAARERAAGSRERLTAREQAVLELLSEGLLARSIATRLDVSERTVHKHLGNLYRKLDAHDRLLAVRRAESLGILEAHGASVAASSR